MTTKRHNRPPRINKQYWERLVRTGRAWTGDDPWLGRMAAALLAAGKIEDVREADSCA